MDHLSWNIRFWSWLGWAVTGAVRGRSAVEKYYPQAVGLSDEEATRVLRQVEQNNRMNQSARHFSSLYAPPSPSANH